MATFSDDGRSRICTREGCGHTRWEHAYPQHGRRDPRPCGHNHNPKTANGDPCACSDFLAEPTEAKSDV